jgi:hypothetical protein
VGNMLTYSREAIRGFCEKYFHFGVLLKHNDLNSIVPNKHLLAAISTIKFVALILL